MLFVLSLSVDAKIISVMMKNNLIFFFESKAVYLLINDHTKKVFYIGFKLNTVRLER